MILNSERMSEQCNPIPLNLCRHHAVALHLEPDARLGGRALRLHHRRPRRPSPEQTFPLDPIPNNDAADIRGNVAAADKLTDKLDIQDEIDAHDNTIGDTNAHEECGQGAAESELYIGEEQWQWQWEELEERLLIKINNKLTLSL